MQSAAWFAVSKGLATKRVVNADHVTLGTRLLDAFGLRATSMPFAACIMLRSSKQAGKQVKGAGVRGVWAVETFLMGILMGTV